MNLNNKKHTIAFLIDETENAYQSVLCKGISEYAYKKNVNLIIFPGRAFNSPFSFEHQYNTIYELISLDQFSGLIIAADTICCYMNEIEINKFFSRFKNIPVISIARKICNVPCIRIDNRNSIKKVMQHLVVKHHCRKIAFLRGPEQNFDSKERFEGYKESIKELGLKYDSELVIQGNNFYETAKNAFQDFYRKQWGNFEAVVVNNDEMVLGVMEVLKANNKKVPRDVLVTGFDNVSFSKYNNPPWTTVEQPIMELGKKSLSLLLKLINGKQVPELTMIKSKLIVRQSCGCLPHIIYQYDNVEKKEITFMKSGKTVLNSDIKEALLNKLSQEENIDSLNFNFIDIFFKLIQKKKITTNDINKFLKQFSDLLQQDRLQGVNIERWHNFLTTIRPFILKQIDSDNKYNIIEDVFQKTRYILGDMILLDFAAMRIENNNKIIQLLNITRRLITVFSDKELFDLIASEFFKIGINYYYIFQYNIIKKNFSNKKWTFPRYSRLLLASDDENIDVGNEIRTREIINFLLRNEKQFQIVILPIFFNYEQIGVMALQFLQGDFGIYKSICGQLSSAMKGSILYNDQKIIKSKLATVLSNLKTNIDQRTAALRNEIEKRKQSEKKARLRNLKLKGINEELKAATEELEATNEEFEVQNEELLVTGRELEKSEGMFRALIEATNDLFWELDKNFFYTGISPGVKDILGYHPDEIIGKSFYDFLAPEEVPRVKAAFEKLVKKGKEVENIEWINIDNKGNAIWFETNGIIVFNDKKLFSGFRGVSRNITERKKALEELAVSKQRLAIHVEKTPLALIEWDVNFNIIAWNKSAENIFGYTAREALGKNMLKFIFPYDLFEKEKLKWRQLLKNKKNESSLHENITCNKNNILCEWYSTVLVDHNSKLIGGASLVLNITEKTRIQEFMVQNEKMMTVGGLAAGMAHEINNPLSIIIQGVQSILRSISSRNIELTNDNLNKIEQYFHKRGIIEYLKGIEKAGFRAANIVTDMMQFSNKSHLDKKEAVVNELIDDTIDIAVHDYNFEKKYSFSKINIIKHYSKKLPLLNCVKTEIRQVVLNLLKNSAQAIFNYKKKNYQPQIEISTYKKKNFIIIKVSDNGPGMDDYIKQHIFEPFFTTKAIDQGTGLGLSVSYYIVTNNHNGKMRVVSEEKKGTTFFIELPFKFLLGK